MCTLFHCFLATPKEEKEEKMKWMWRHKSLGVLTGMVVAPRLAYRLFNIGKVRKVIMNNIYTCKKHDDESQHDVRD